MDLLERLKKIMKEQFGIETGEQLMEAVENLEGVDLGIFVTPFNLDSQNTKVAS